MFSDFFAHAKVGDLAFFYGVSSELKSTVVSYGIQTVYIGVLYGRLGYSGLHTPSYRQLPWRCLNRLITSELYCMGFSGHTNMFMHS